MVIKKITNIFLFSLLLIIFVNLSGFSFAKEKAMGWSDGYVKMPIEIGHHTSQIYKGKIYTIGGMDASEQSVNTVNIYDIKSNSWSTGAPMPTSRFSMTSELFEEKIYVAGGVIHDDEGTPKMEIYDIKSNKWTTGADMLPGYDYQYLSSVVYGGKIYCITITDIQVYDIKSDSWSLLTSIPTPRNAMESELYNGKIYCMGGFFGGSRTNVVEVYDIKTNKWSSVSSMPTAKNVFASEIYGGKIYTIGGYNAGILDKVEIYDIATDQWTSGPSMISGRAELETAREGNKIYAIGGLDKSWLKTGVIEVLALDDLSSEQNIVDAVEKAESTGFIVDIENARELVNSLEEGSLKESLQERLNFISVNIDMPLKDVSANLDVYIKSENMISVSLDTNSVIFDDFSGVNDVEQPNAINMTINSSLPYQVNVYLVDEIQNSDKSKVMDKSILNIKANSESSYNIFADTISSITLLDNQSSGNHISHGIDLKLKGNIAHKKDVYKATVKLEVKQK